ncbi:hypothetical protein HNR42_000482 [Deinobacterium chartae]|uniref:AAA domain-containing protein n=1 Tax=Deinobacterium chartae TaxID=521158 RepID=A0A841HYP7_9DEIO|nr:AAA family ATPase [Deinobacterium chartae]MBB6097068.1 hypothetical protein [Deinobacterium chartae]
MIIWINGPFGVGKTTLSQALVQRLPQARLYDPEVLGRWILRLTPRPLWPLWPNDYQNLRLWQRTTYLSARWRGAGPHALIVPMSVYRPQVFARTIGALRADGLEVRHLALLAPPEVIWQRLERRGRGEHRYSWTGARVEEALAWLSALPPEERLETGNLGPGEVLEAVLGRLNTASRTVLDSRDTDLPPAVL